MKKFLSYIDWKINIFLSTLTAFFSVWVVQVGDVDNESIMTLTIMIFVITFLYMSILDFVFELYKSKKF